jgi:hypothetical protein
MYRFILATVLVVASLVSSQTAAAQAPTLHADAAYGVAYVQTRIVQMPQDQNKPYLTVVGDQNDQNVKMVLNWFETNADLKAIKDQTHFVFMPTTGDSKPARFYRDRYAKTVQDVPCIRFQKADGTLIVELKSQEIPATPEALVNALNRPATECFGRRRQDNVYPAPNPNPAPDTDPSPQPIDRRPAPKPAPHFPWLLLVILTAVGAGVGVVHEYRVMYAKS